MRWFLVSVAAVGMLAGTVLLLGVIAYRSHQANRQLADALAAKQAEQAAAKPPAATSTPAPNKQVPLADSAARKSPLKVEAPKPAGPVFDPAFEKVWAECVAYTKKGYAERASSAAKPLAALPAAYRAEAVARMAKVDTDPYRELPIEHALLGVDELFSWMLHTGAWAAVQDPDFKVVAAGIWGPEMVPEQLSIIAGQYACLAPPHRQGIVDAIRKKASTAEIPPRIRFELSHLGAEKVVGRRTFAQILEDLQAASEYMDEENNIITPKILEKSSPPVRRVAESTMQRVKLNASWLSSQQALELALQHHFSVWYLTMCIQAALKDEQLKSILSILYHTGANWKDLFTMTKMYYCEDSRSRAEIAFAINNHRPARSLSPALYNKIADMGGQKWLDR